MSELTSKLQIPYPSENEKPWYSIFESMVAQVDANDFAGWEDGNLIQYGGGTISWDGDNLEWTLQLVFATPTFGRLIAITPATIKINPGEFLVVDLTRGPTTHQTGVFQTVTTVQVDIATKVIAYRPVGTNDLYFYNGLRFEAGDASDGTLGNAGGGGGGGSLTVRDEGSVIEASTSQLNFVGGQVTATSAGPGLVDVTISALGAIEVQDEGITVDAAASLLNFKGDAVVATSPLAGQVDLDINKPTKYEMAMVPTVIDAADTVTIPVGFQYIVYDTFTVDGTLIIEGQLVEL